MNDELYNEVRKGIENRLADHEERLDEYSKRLAELDKSSVENGIRIDNLCAQLASLVTTLRWFIGLMIGAFVTFFFYAAQRGLISYGGM